MATERSKRRQKESPLRKIERYLQSVDARSDHPYDGVLGVPPEWVPEAIREEFIRARDRLLTFELPDHSKPTPEIVRTWINAYITIGERDAAKPLWPDAFNHRSASPHIGTLAKVFAASVKGKDKGLELLLGKGTVKALAEMERNKERSIGGKISAVTRRQKSEENREKVRKMYLNSTSDPRDRAAQISRATGIPVRTVRKYTQGL